MSDVTNKQVSALIIIGINQIAPPTRNNHAVSTTESGKSCQFVNPASIQAFNSR